MSKKSIMTETNQRLTRGKGVLEPLLASLRAQRANQLIPYAHRSGRILDIGCGTYPYFLSRTSFKHKFAIDQLPLNPTSASKLDIKWHSMDLNKIPKVPFEDDFFNVVTLLAVVEHLNPSSLALLFREIHRVLQPEGIVILTTPAAWSDHLLHLMAHLRLVSAEEIDEHAYAYTLPLIGWYFGQSGFLMKNVKFGYFELGLNMWATATK
jgi:SAM-dependent methyltransferase